jgi:hypothetical protein
MNRNWMKSVLLGLNITLNNPSQHFVHETGVYSFTFQVYHVSRIFYGGAWKACVTTNSISGFCCDLSGFCVGLWACCDADPNICTQISCREHVSPPPKCSNGLTKGSQTTDSKNMDQATIINAQLLFIQ